MAVIHQLEMGPNGQPAVAYVEYLKADRVAVSAYRFSRGRSLPGDTGGNLPVAMITFSGGGALTGLITTADGAATTIRLGRAFVKTSYWAGRASQNDSVIQYSMMLGVDVAPGLQVRLENSSAHESDGFLGAIGTGGFTTGNGSSVALKGVALRYKADLENASFGGFCSWRQGRASSRYPDSILTGIDARLAQGAAGAWMSSGRNSVAFVVSQPLHVTGGDMGMKIATGRTDSGSVVYNTPTVVLSPGSHQNNFELGFVHRSKHYMAGLNLVYVNHPANEPQLSRDAGVMATLAMRL